MQQILLEKDYKTQKIRMISNDWALPSHSEIDIIIKKFQHLKKTMTNKEIKDYNKERWEELQPSRRERKLSRNTETKKPTKKNGYVYVIKCDKYYKIGISQTFISRKKKYITENPKEVKTILCVKVQDYINVEKQILEAYEDKNIRGEWFRLNKDDIQSIKNLLDKILCPSNAT